MNFKAENNRVYFSFLNVDVCLSSRGAGQWRLQSAVYGDFDDKGAIGRLLSDIGEEYSPVFVPVRVDDVGNKLKIYDEAGNSAVISEVAISFRDADKREREVITSLVSNGNNTSVTFVLDENKHFYGTGERFDGADRTGKKQNIYAIDRWCQTRGNSYCPVPFVVSSDNTGVFINRYEHQVFDIGKTDEKQFSVVITGAPLDMFVFTGNSPAEIVRCYCDITGYAPMPAPWLFGTQVCRYWPDFSTTAGVLDMTEKMAEHDLPWESVIIEGWHVYDNTRHEELKQLVDTIHNMGKKILVYEGCGRIPEKADEFYGITDAMAVHAGDCPEIDETSCFNPVDHASGKKMKVIDYTNPDASAKWDELWDYLVNDIGVDGAKIDFCEQVPEYEAVTFADGRNPAGSHHLYPTAYNIMQYKRFSSKKDGGMNLSRGGGIGAQRYPVIWAGDQRREFRFMKAVLSAVLSSGFSGIPFMTWDMAGYRASFNAYDFSHESRVFLRGVQFSAFSSVIQTHGKVKRPYDFDEKTIALYRAYSKLHETLRPYITEQAEISVKTGIPLMRHLFFYDNTDEACKTTEDEYMFGDSFLVAPVMTKACRRDVYLPKGTWVDIFTNSHYTGPINLNNYPAKPEIIPVFRLIDPAPSVDAETIEDINSITEEIRALSKKKFREKE